MIPIRIRLLWHKQAQFAGYLLAEELGLARGKGVEIRCEGLDFSCKHVASILTGVSEMAVASPAHILESAAPERLRWLMTVQQVSPLVYPARRSSGVNALADLAGKSVGVWPGGEDLEFRWLLAGAGVAPGAVARVQMPDTVGPFLRGEIASGQMTSYHELHQVEAEVPPGDLVVFSGRETGRSVLKDGLVADAALVAEKPEVVQAVVDAVLEGWTIAFDDPDRAVAACLRARPDVSRAEHARQLADIRALSLTGATLAEGLGCPDPAHLAAAARAIREVEGHEPATEGVLDDRFWKAAPAAFRRRDWAV